MGSGSVFISAEHLQHFTAETLYCTGMERPNTEISADVLVSADLRGIESHGISRLRMDYDGLKSGWHNPQICIEIVSDQDAAVGVDGHGRMGHPVGVHAMQLAIEKARRFGAGLNALLPLGGAGEEMGGQKGCGLAVMVELLCTAPQDNAYMGHLPPGKGLPAQVGHFFMALDIEHFVPLESKAISGEIVRELRAAEKAPGQSRIYTAGEKEFELEKQRWQTGIPISANLSQELGALRGDAGLGDEWLVESSQGVL